MGIIFSTLKKILFWSYDRGSWQYDLMCVLIVLFILLAPNRWFHSRSSRPTIVTASEIKTAAQDSVEQQIARRLSQKEHRQVRISRIEEVVDESGQTSYLVWTD
jgi:uncharacterized membrane protein YfhO